ncbi:MAG: hypothetical protein JWQ66_2663 [Mucilaginibacter sp.]|nr:hypothetical protein [Mucilaginibacter sp.]
MHRIRTSLPYFKDFGWEAEIVSVAEKYSEVGKDDLLVQSVNADIKIHQVKALSKKLTSKIGLGSLALRSLWYYRQKVNDILKNEKYDLIYFSTTQFPVCVLGAYWKKRFNIPYVIDMQDPWHSEYYQDKPKLQQPSKYWFSYRLHKYLEPIAMKHVSGLISVSEHYINDLKTRYPVALTTVPSATITFGAFEQDLKIAIANQDKFESLLQKGYRNIVYVGRGGIDMHKAIIPVFEALRNGLKSQPDVFCKLKFYFIGTSYAPQGKGNPTILPLAIKYGVENNVIEITDRISYYHSLITLIQADALFIPGSDDPKYTASKIYPYLLAKKTLLANFDENSSVVKILKECTRNGIILTFDQGKAELTDIIYLTLTNWGNDRFRPIEVSEHFDKFSAKYLTGKQTELFNKAIIYFEAKNSNA